MGISLKLLLYKGKLYADGTRPVVIQYIINSKVKRKVVGRCLEEHWDEKTNRVKAKVKNATALNHRISAAFSEAEKEIYKVQSGDKPIRSLFDPVSPTTFNGAVQQELVRLKIEMKAGAYNKLIGYSSQIKDYCDTDILELKDMDLNWFKGYTHFLTQLGNEGATSQKKVKTIRAVVLRYLGKEKVSEELRCYRIPTKKTIKQKLDTGEFARLESLELPEGDIVLAVRDLFLLQVYLRGIRVGDLLQAGPDQFNEGFFKYKDDKTGQNFSIKIIPRAQVIIDKYLSTDDRLFPFFKWQHNPKLNDFDNKVKRLKDKESCTSVINKYLKMIATMADISKPLSSHIARHTFARMAIDKINNPMVTMELMGHSSLVVHQQYLNDLRKDEELDRAADDIFS
jgi:integrase/recombinase XerD